MALTRAICGLTIDLMSNAAQQHDALLANAYLNGRRAGLAHLSPSLCEVSPGTPETNEWLRGWRSGIDQRAQELNARLMVKHPCRYGRQDACDCGGRGLCVDAA